ncbi:hypothetical protein, partial [Streptomyces sp. PU_AKi4]|uniref:hypothetical protein n=1 Tax=Streptomyces sp. PU_AKi4 TaxID=2800809 RepID=UPI0035241123
SAGGIRPLRGRRTAARSSGGHDAQDGFRHRLTEDGGRLPGTGTQRPRPDAPEVLPPQAGRPLRARTTNTADRDGRRTAA